MSSHESGVIKINTGGEAREDFEVYKKDYTPELADNDYEDIRSEIATYYDVPETNVYFVPDTMLAKRRRTQRAFSIVIMNDGNKYYADGRTAHAILLKVLKNQFKLDFEPGDDTYTSVHGFLDPEGFEESEAVKKKSEEIGRPITWFVRYTTSSPSSPQPKQSPLEIG